MTRGILVRAAVCPALALVVLALTASSVVADGEAGIVVVWGDGTTSSVCVPFEGNSITGDGLIAAAGFGLNDYSGAVCSINGVGCTHSGTFNSCLCQCQVGSQDCIYWSFFTREYGDAWIYSPLGYRSVSSSNGDLQAWQWLPASPSAPPASPSQTFEDVCGHPPLTALPSPPPPPPPPDTTIPPSPGTTQPSPAGVTSPVPVPTDTAAASTGIPTVSLTPLPGVTPTLAATPAPPSSGEPGEGGDGAAALLRFSAVVAALLAGMAGLFFLRRRRGG